MPASKKPKLSPEEQHARFVTTAKQLGCDESEEHFDDKLRKITKSEAPTPADHASNTKALKRNVE